MGFDSIHCRCFKQTVNFNSEVTLFLFSRYPNFFFFTFMFLNFKVAEVLCNCFSEGICFSNFTLKLGQEEQSVN